MHNPSKYAEILSRFKYVISPDFSQHSRYATILMYAKLLVEQRIWGIIDVFWNQTRDFK